MTKKNKNPDCPVCHGKGKVKVIKPIAHIFSWHLGRETYEDPCFFCNLDEFEKDCHVPGVEKLH